MAEPIGALRGELSLSAAQFEADIKAARSALRREAGAMEQSMGSFQAKTEATLKTIANLSIVAAGAGAALFAMSKVAIDAADNIAKTADKVGVTTDALQELRFAADLSGVSANVMDTALQRLARRTGEAAQGAGVLAKVFEQYGIAATDSEGRVRETEAVLRDIAEAMARAGSEQERLRIAVAAFDTEGAGLVNLLRDGEGGLDRLTGRARELGIVMDESLVRKAEVASDRLTELQTVMRTKAQVMALQLMPVLERFAELMTSPQLLAGIDNIARTFADVIEFAVTYNREIIAGVVGLQAAARLPIANPYAKLAAGAGAAYLTFQQLTPETEKLQGVLADQAAEVERLEHAWRRTADPEIARGVHEQMMEAVAAAAETRRQIEALSAGPAMEGPDLPRRPMVEPFQFSDPVGAAGGGDGGLAAQLQREEEMRKDSIDRQIEAIRQSLMTREELESQAQERRLESLRDGLEAGLISEQEFGELRLETEMATLERLNELRDEQLQQERQMAEQQMEIQQRAEDFIRNQKLQTASLAANLLQTMAGKSKAAALAALALNKAVAVANIAIQTAQAMSAAVAPPPLGLGPVAGQALAAQMKAFGAAQIGLVLATGLAQGFAGAAGGAVGGGGSGGSASAAASGLAQGGGRGGIAFLSLDSRRSRFTADEVQDIAEQLNELIGDGFDLREVRVRAS